MSMSADSPPARLLEANAEWAARVHRTSPDFFPQRQQSPKILWIGCADSRIPESVVTNARPGDIFVHRNIANQLHPDDDSALAVLTFAVDELRIEHVVVTGHTHCSGALASLRAARGDDAPAPAPDTPLGRWLAPLVDLVRTLDPPPADLDAFVRANVRRQVDNICRTDVVRSAWSQGRQLHVHGWLYDVETGRISDLGVSRGKE